MKILAVDDEAGSLKLLVRAIGRVQENAEVFSTQRASEALAYAKEHFPDVAFLDIQMPEITGLELAKKLKAIHPKINIIFCTGYSDYAMEAMKMHSSGYILKPVTAEDVGNELSSLRNPVPSTEKNEKMYARTFGSFDFFVDGKPVTFRRERAKELLAFLIDRAGSSASRKEISSVIFEDREYTRATQAYLSQIIKSLSDTLKDYGASGVLLSDYNSYSVDTSLFGCDAYDYLAGEPSAINSYVGDYMQQYSWAEESKYKFMS